MGRQLREKVLQNYYYLKGELEKNGRKVFGNPCAILPVFIGNEIVCRLVSRLMMDMGNFCLDFRCSCERDWVSSCENWSGKTESKFDATTYKITFGYVCKSVWKSPYKSNSNLREANENIRIAMPKGAII